MKPIVRKVLDSGLIDKHLTKLLETWGYLPAGSADDVKEDALKTATYARLVALAEDLAQEFELDTPIRETPFHLVVGSPVHVTILHRIESKIFGAIVVDLFAVMDKMGRFVFRFNDVKEEWFVPGYLFSSHALDISNDYDFKRFQVLSHRVLYENELPVAVEVSVAEVNS